MAYTDKIATITFKSVQFGLVYVIDIYDRDTYAGDVIDLVLTGQPAFLRYGGKGILLSGKHGSELTINILASPSDDYDWIKTGDSTKYLVELTRSTISIWKGYVLPGSVVEDYLPYRVISVIATDRLGLLGDTPYLDELIGYPVQGTESMLTSLRRVLNGTGISLPVRSSVNLFDTAMNVTANDDPLVQAFTRQERFMDVDLNPSSMATVLDALLETMDIRAFQSCGYWYLIRTIEYASADLACRDFNVSTGALIQNVSLSVQQTAVTPPNFVQGTFYLLKGTQVENTLGLKRISIVENNALKPSALTAYNFPAKEFVAGSPRHYTISGSSGWKMVNNNDACLMYCPADDYVADEYFESDSYSVYAISALPTRLIIKGGYITSGSTLGQWIIHLSVTDGVDTYYWHNSGWSTSDTKWKPLCKTAKLDRPEDHEFTIDAWPIDGLVTIRFYDIPNNNPFISEILLTPAPSDDYSFASGRETTAVIDDNNITIPQEQSMILTSTTGITSWMTSFYDGFIRTLSASGDPATVWRPRGSSGTYYDLKDWKIQSQIDQFKTPGLKLRARFIGIYDYHKTLIVPGLNDRVFVPDDVEIDLRQDIITGTFFEIKTPATEVSYTTETEVVSAPGAIGKGISRGGYIVDVLPIQTGGQKIVVSGSSVLKAGSVAVSGGSTSGVTEYCRAKKGVALTAGSNTIAFTDALQTGSTYVIYAKAYTAEGYEMGYTISNESVTGFDIAVDEAGTLDYQIMREL